MYLEAGCIDQGMSCHYARASTLMNLSTLVYQRTTQLLWTTDSVVPLSSLTYWPFSTVAMLSVSKQCVVKGTHRVQIQNYVIINETKSDQQTTWQQLRFVPLQQQLNPKYCAKKKVQQHNPYYQKIYLHMTTCIKAHWILYLLPEIGSVCGVAVLFALMYNKMQGYSSCHLVK